MIQFINFSHDLKLCNIGVFLKKNIHFKLISSGANDVGLEIYERELSDFLETSSIITKIYTVRNFNFALFYNLIASYS